MRRRPFLGSFPVKVAIRILLAVLLPPLQIQRAIVETLSVIQDKNNILRSEANAYESLFTTLLHEVMSGEREIKPL